MINISNSSPIIGIYKITSPSGKIYIGQSIDVNQRVSKYKNLLCYNQTYLFNSLRKYGWEQHKFEIIEECSIEQLNERERYWQDYYNVINKNKGLNCRLTETNDRSGRFIKLEKPILQYDLKENFIKEWHSIREAGRNLNINIGNISQCVNNKALSAGGFKWKFKSQQKSIFKNHGSSKSVIQMDKNNNIIKIWKTLSEVEKF